MNVAVEVEFEAGDINNFFNRNGMFKAAEGLTNDVNSIHIFNHPDRENCLIAEFTINKTSQYKVVDTIADEFRNILPNYTDLTIRFPKKTK